MRAGKALFAALGPFFETSAALRCNWTLDVSDIFHCRPVELGCKVLNVLGETWAVGIHAGMSLAPWLFATSYPPQPAVSVRHIVHP